MPATTALFRRCLDEAVQASSPLIASCIDDAVSALQAVEKGSIKAAERQDASDAWHELLRHRAAWIERYPRELRAALEAPAATAAPAVRPIVVKLDALTLVNDDQVDQQIESSRLSQLLQTAAGQPLDELDGLVSSLLGLPAVRPEQNPLRPDVFARVLRGVMADAGQQPGLPSLWTRHMAPTMGRELEQLYRRLAQLLTQANVHAASYRVLPIRSAPPAGARAAGDHAPGPAAAWSPAAGAAPAGAPRADVRMRAGSAWADLQSYPRGEELIQEFLSHGGGASEAPLAAAYYARVSTDLAQLEAAPDDELRSAGAQAPQHYAQLPVVDRPLRPVSTDTTLDREVWGEYAASRRRSLVRTRLKQQARHAGQVLGLELVRKLVNQVAQDPRLLAPVRESIVALEPSLLRLAMVDPRFFSQEDHPGRRLVERVAERSFKYNDEFSAEFVEFSASVAASFNLLNALGADEVRDAKPFASALAALEAAWSAQDAQEEDARKAVLDAVRFAEQRQLEADQIAWELGQRSDLQDVPRIVQDFLYGPWSLVMAHARLTARGREIDPGGHGSVISDLLWSVKREATLREPARMIEMLPGLLQRLRHGLAALGQAPQESDLFFHGLEKLHRPVLRLRARKRRESSDFAPLGPEAEAEVERPEPVQEPRRVHSPWMGRSELDAAGFGDTLPSDHAELMPSDGEGPQPRGHGDDAAAAEAAPAEIGSVIAGLSEGCWVDLYSKRRWLRAQLVWASSKGTLFMFVSHGGQPHSMTRRSCERLVRERLLRTVDTHGPVSHAIGVLAQSQPQPLQSDALAA